MPIDKDETSSLSSIENGNFDSDGYQKVLKKHETDILNAISKNYKILQKYPPRTYLRVDYSNMAFAAAAQHIFNVLSRKTRGGIANVYCHRDDKKRRTGHGYFIMKSRKYAKKLIQQEGIVIDNRKVYFECEEYSELVKNPIYLEELIREWKSREDENQDNRQGNGYRGNHRDNANRNGYRNGHGDGNGNGNGNRNGHGNGNRNGNGDGPRNHYKNGNRHRKFT